MAGLQQPGKKRGPGTGNKYDAAQLFESAVRTLAVRSCSTEDLRAKLRRKARTASEVDGVIGRLKEIGYLNDERFAESFASNRVENDGFGRARILNDLRTKRIPPKLAEKAVERALDGRGEAEMLDSFIERKMPSLRAAGPIEDQKVMVRAYNRLRRAGFSSGGSLAALKRLAARPEELPEEFAEEGVEEGGID